MKCHIYSGRGGKGREVSRAERTGHVTLGLPGVPSGLGDVWRLRLGCRNRWESFCRRIQLLSIRHCSRRRPDGGGGRNTRPPNGGGQRCRRPRDRGSRGHQPSTGGFESRRRSRHPSRISLPVMSPVLPDSGCGRLPCPGVFRGGVHVLRLVATASLGPSPLSDHRGGSLCEGESHLLLRLLLWRCVAKASVATSVRAAALTHPRPLRSRRRSQLPQQLPHRAVC
mmetsp:Transcript_17085/g.35056  ORF Transcript_17085/g.35056 Transcript_17085/m.35056 type:complete len:225 (+) Transcript_17085:300-974(+)